MIIWQQYMNPKLEFLSFELLGRVEQLHKVFFKTVTNRQDLIGGSIIYVMSAVIYDLGYDTKMIKRGKI